MSVVAAVETGAGFFRAKTLQDVEAVRVIRNAGREWMTGDTSEITPEQQAEWWRSLDHDNTQLYVLRGGALVVAYGMLSRHRYGALWVSVAVAPEKRGMGFGTFIFKHFGDFAREPLWAEIRRDNAASVRAAEKAGYSRVGSTERGLLYVRYQR